MSKIALRCPSLGERLEFVDSLRVSGGQHFELVEWQRKMTSELMKIVDINGSSSSKARQAGLTGARINTESTSKLVRARRV